MISADTNEQKQERLNEAEEIGADTLLSLPIEEMRTCQHERLAAETTADKDTRLQQISELQHKLKSYQLRVPLKEIAADSTPQCERLAAETTERDANFTANETN